MLKCNYYIDYVFHDNKKNYFNMYRRVYDLWLLFSKTHEGSEGVDKTIIKIAMFENKSVWLII